MPLRDHVENVLTALQNIAAELGLEGEAEPASD
jgi:predicted hydrolase (HD superfamily)